MPVPLNPLDKWMDNVALAGLCSKETLWATYRLACDCIRSGIPGDFVECGVYGGANSAVMARAVYEEAYYVHGDELDSRFHGGPDGGIYSTEQVNPFTRRVHLFDTFAGIPLAGPEDKEYLEAGHQEGLSTCDLESVKAHMREWSLPAELFVYHPGDFKNTCSLGVLMFDPQPWLKEIALLRLDGDLYRSTTDALQLLAAVQPGGWVIIDDFALSGARQAVLESPLRGMPAYFNMQRQG